MDSPLGTIIAYATQAGRTADDGDGRNSPFTTAFLNNVEQKEEIGTVFVASASTSINPLARSNFQNFPYP